ncbi:MAG TPA: AmmeMemoRadiSam system radical SAM enzyme [Spirochaetota bacterium]|nr:AmmeMemoRadiSam system radical SAM enzyme [Spirochaetota bacterium]HOS40874.1 AmmeMemoRadiSam system radical SAM enzyme [Spirochaetota bacterium]HPI22447.1 AmmeMemoRadiSam system radical SAM enzyme [Spirochaetota bacterium]HPU88814.1 AmmeMemoRadiSam system radical SAM enzyme [Spirochaetota bacterium]
MEREARHYSAESGSAVRCHLCPHECRIAAGAAGTCGVRINRDGKLFSAIYGEVTSVAMDPIEKKPLYHFHPGSQILSIGTKGCNFRCAFCQNWSISQDLNARTAAYRPEDIVQAARTNNSIGIAYTYSEPIIWFEYVLECARLAREAGLKNVMVTNGFVNPAPRAELLELIDAMNIDLKTFNDDTYRRIPHGRLQPVLDTIVAAHAAAHVEITTLVVTGMNDTMEEMRAIIDWIAALDPGIPWHISRYHPSYKYDAPATDVDFMLRVHEAARKKLHHVYCGNIANGRGTSDTHCPSCGAVLVARSGYATRITGISNGACVKCGRASGIVQ